jgi:hypothetical protein
MVIPAEAGVDIRVKAREELLTDDASSDLLAQPAGWPS